MRGLRGNWSDVQSFLYQKSPDMLALSETNIDESVDIKEFDIPGYSPLITKHDHLHRNMHGLGFFVKDGLPCARDVNLE